jgi:ribosome-binding factor A
MSLRMEAGFEHLREALAQVFAEHVEFPPGVLVTVMGAKVTANTAHARVVLSVFPETMQTEAKRILADNDREIKEELAHHLRLRRIPRLHYVFDEREAYVGKIDDVILDLKKKGEIDPGL